MIINSNKAFDLLRKYAEEYSDATFLYEVYAKLSSEKRNSNVLLRLDQLEVKKYNAYRRFTELHNICNLQKNEATEIGKILLNECESVKEYARNMYWDDMNKADYIRKIY